MLENKKYTLGRKGDLRYTFHVANFLLASLYLTKVV